MYSRDRSQTDNVNPGDNDTDDKEMEPRGAAVFHQSDDPDQKVTTSSIPSADRKRGNRPAFDRDR